MGVSVSCLVIYQSIGQLECRSIGLLVVPSICQLVHRTVRPSFNQSIHQPINQSINQSFNQSIETTNQPIKNPTNQQTNHKINLDTIPFSLICFNLLGTFTAYLQQKPQRRNILADVKSSKFVELLVETISCH